MVYTSGLEEAVQFVVNQLTSVVSPDHTTHIAFSRNLKLLLPICDEAHNSISSSIFGSNHFNIDIIGKTVDHGNKVALTCQTSVSERTTHINMQELEGLGSNESGSLRFLCNGFAEIAVRAVKNRFTFDKL
jgi:hypothetical protein